MYPFFIEQEPQVLSLNDYLQLQALLAQEQAERERCLYQEYQKKKEEQRRLQKAMYRLQVMTEIYRRREQEELKLQAYYAARRKQQEEEQRRKYLMELQRQQYYAALRQEQEQLQQERLQREHYRLLAMAQQQQKAVQALQPSQVFANATASTIAADDEFDSDLESESKEEAHYQDQLVALVKLIFGDPQLQDGTKQHQENVAVEEQVTDSNEQDNNGTYAEVNEDHEVSEGTSAEEDGDDQAHIELERQALSLDEFIDYIHKKAQSLDESESESEQEDDHVMEEDTAEATDIQHIDNNEDSIEEEYDNIPSLVDSNTEIRGLVNEILTSNTEQQDQEFTHFPEEDPVKIAKYDALSRIEQELKDIRQKHEDHILHVNLDFSDSVNGDRASSPDNLIIATTAENREFLGYEDQIMKILLKLDMIDSDGDSSIRNERKVLVKLAEQMLEKLDDYKQREWERVSCSSQSEDEDTCIV